MKPIPTLVTLGFVVTILCGCAPGSYLASINEDCKKYQTPDARAACESKYKESAREFEKYREQKKSAESDTGADRPSKDSLCFKRSSGEVVCPN